MNPKQLRNSTLMRRRPLESSKGNTWLPLELISLIEFLGEIELGKNIMYFSIDMVAELSRKVKYLKNLEGISTKRNLIQS